MPFHIFIKKELNLFNFYYFKISENSCVLYAEEQNKIRKLIEKIESKKNQNFKLFKTLKTHLLPLTNCAFNKNGNKYMHIKDL